MHGMNGIQIKQLDPYCSDVYAFRKEIICTDENSDEKYLNGILPRDSFTSEEVWKFSKKKWDSIGFDGLFGVYYNNELAAISGSKLYGANNEYVRLGMMYYVLKRFRKSVRSTLWAPGGMIETALSYHKLTSIIEYSFVSIYPHNSKLAALCTMMSRRNGYGQIGSTMDHIDLMKSFTMYRHPIYFKNVTQHILYRAEISDANSINTLIGILDERK